jgi:hypothetical protein
VCKSCPTIGPDGWSQATEPRPHEAVAPMMSSNYIIWFEAYEEEHRSRVGEQGRQPGNDDVSLPVPPGSPLPPARSEILHSHRDPRGSTNWKGSTSRIRSSCQISFEVRKLIEGFPCIRRWKVRSDRHGL